MSPTRESARSNPYDCAAPGRLFVGYEELLREILRGLGDGKSYALLGGRRCGKTSLLLRLQEELHRSEAVPFQVLPRFLDIQAVVPRSPFDFFSRLYALVSEGLEVPGWTSPPPGQTYDEFLSRLDELQPWMERKHGPGWLVVLLIDELDAALKYLPDDECFQNLRNFLTVSRYKAYFRVVASGCSEMGKLIGAGSPLNNLHKQFTRALMVAEARELVAFGFPEGLEATVEAELLRSTGRHAYVLQGLLEKLFDEPRPFSMEKVHRAGERFVRDHASEFKVWHRDLGEAGRACYAALAKVEPESLDRKALRAHVGPGIVIADGLMTLDYHGLLHLKEETGHRYIEGTLFKDWFLEDAPQQPPVSMTTHPTQVSAPMNDEFPPPLIEACRTRKLALFVGSGASMGRDVGGGFPAWKDLPLRLLEACHRYGAADASLIEAKKRVFERDLSLEVMLAELGSLRAALTRDYQDALNDVFRPRNLAPGAVHQAMGRLGVRAILTTNYDGLIEEGRESPRRHVYTWKESTQALNDLKSDRPVLFKIHGTAERADTVVMTETEYRQARAERSYQAVLSHLIQEYTFLFIGYGMNDPLDLDLVLRWNAEVFNSAAPRHYVLMKQPGREARDRYLRDYNVQVISYDDHARLPERLEDLQGLASTLPGSRPAGNATLLGQASPAQARSSPAALRGTPPVSETLTPSRAQSDLSTTRDQVFISYSRKDKKWLERLQTHLKPRIRNGKVHVWSDDRIQAGDEWRKEIERALARARVAVLLVSPDFVASDFIARNELHPLLEAAKREGVRILWVPVKTAAFQEANLDMYQGVLDPARPLNRRHHAYVDEAMEEICNAIIKAFSGA
ncbi:hypothetical protein BO221_06695 [Archangium sp. Cb G35]|uniref:SIR2 family protein n=1 Tax=Archangium sp. Cb G35 TaxID=1920190 RepID=UPI0009374AA5|nr:SIR2 family protein [Archangium sp. Cb G35]OJT25555.1 hypothetical protein BO221_06695 [Archangium sp. Cb G35]